MTYSINISLRPGNTSLPRYRERDLLFTTARAKNLEPGRGQWPAIEVPAIVVGYTRTGIASGRGIGAPVTGVAILPALTQPGHHPTGGIATGTTRSTAPGTIGMAIVAATSEELPAAEVRLAPDIIPQGTCSTLPLSRQQAVHAEAQACKQSARAEPHTSHPTLLRTHGICDTYESFGIHMLPCSSFCKL